MQQVIPDKTSLLSACLASGIHLNASRVWRLRVWHLASI